MRRNRRAGGFTAIRVEGGLFPYDFVQRVAQRQATQQSDADYGVSRSLDLKEELARYWRIANDLYSAFVERRQRKDLDPHRVTADEFLVPLLRDVFGFREVRSTAPITVNERRFPLTHVAFDGAVPMALVPWLYELDRGDQRFGDETRRRAPHSLIQEYLNASKDSLWGIVSNGLRLRLLRDNPSLTRPAYVEADLQLIFEEELYSDFVALWLIIHASRFEPRDDSPASCILEKWLEKSREIGQRALSNLRDGVEQALRELGSGFLEHPANAALRDRIASGQLSAMEYFQELLRLVYRLLFLFTVEDRDLLHFPEATKEQRDLYARGYSVGRLRERALRGRHFDQHTDLWQSLLIVFRGLAHGAEPLGLPALGGLFHAEQCPNLDSSMLSNQRLLGAVRSLAYVQSDQGLVRVNYRDMDTEELGSVYESLLEFYPRIDVDAKPWTFGFVSDVEGNNGAGSARKLTGSYYTPPSLVNELIKSTLELVMEEAIRRRPEDPRSALLELKIIDPACGSGHFLLAAARRMAAEIARLESGTDTPDEKTRQRALREVVRHCIYGVDLNPLGVELCRAALWIETVEPGKPLTFLNSHIVCGNSLVGLMDSRLAEKGIPDKAYDALTGDDKSVSKRLKEKQRKALREGVQTRLPFAVRETLGAVAADIEEMPEETIEDIEAKRKAWEYAYRHDAIRHAELEANLFTAAFFAPKTKENEDRIPLTEDIVRLRLGMDQRPGVAEYVNQLARQHRFLHWHIVFPSILRRDGFDVVIGNPPWERVKLQEQEFFANRSTYIASAPNKAERNRRIKELARPDATPAEKALLEEFETAKRESEATSLFLRTSGRFPLTGRGDVNTYAVFAETFFQLMSPKGRAGFIVPSGLATDNTTKDFFAFISTNGHLVSLYDFENRERLFPDVDSRVKFSLVTLGHGVQQAEFVCFVTSVDQLREDERRFVLTPRDFALINPNTRTCPVFRSKADAELTKKIYARIPVLVDESKGREGNPWGVQFATMFHMSNDSGLFRTYQQMLESGARLDGITWVDAEGNRWVPLYEAKMIHHYDHRWATYESDGETVRDRTDDEKRLLDTEPLPRYWVPEDEVEKRLRERGWDRQWLMGWRDVCRSTDERTVIASVLPRLGVGHTLPLIFLPTETFDVRLVAVLLANLSTLVFDYVARIKLGGTHLTFFVLKQLPVLSPRAYDQTSLDFISSRVLELAYTSLELKSFAQDLGYGGPPFLWNPSRRAVLRAELDAYFAHLYGLSRDELRYILDPADVFGEQYPSVTFPTLKRNEIREYGEYRTQRLVLEAWDRLTASGMIR